MLKRETNRLRFPPLTSLLIFPQNTLYKDSWNELQQSPSTPSAAGSRLRQTDGCSTEQKSLTGAQLVCTEKPDMTLFGGQKKKTSWVFQYHHNNQVRNGLVVVSHDGGVSFYYTINEYH